MADRSKSRGSGGGPGGNGASAGTGGADVRPSADRSPATELIDRGLSLYANGDLEAALAVWQRALAVDTKSRRARDYVTYVEDHYDVIYRTAWKWCGNRADADIHTTVSAEVSNADVVVDDTVTINAIAPANDQERRELYGFEVSGSHAFSYLPSPLDGFGVTGGYNYVESDFEFPDPSPAGPFVATP